MSDAPRSSMSRRRLLKVAGTAAAGAAAWGKFPRAANAHDLRPNDPTYHFAEYEAIVNRELTVRQVYEWPNINKPILLANVSNGLNAFQFSYDVPPSYTQVVVQPYFTANVAVYDDFVWDKYQWGELLGITDPATKQPAAHNLWYKSPNPAPASVPTDRANPYYKDTSIEGLQRRGVLFLT